ncbi:MAG: diguanylate cyclase [Vogesella sp.]|uniref:diguanylate cyclase n=1 Tax=Vogesella sp. TaxID=1904252 RepID=UPI00391DFF5F
MPVTNPLETALAALPGGYLLLDTQQRVSFVSTRFQQLLHCPPLQAGQTLPPDLLPEELWQALVARQTHGVQQVYGGQLLDWLLTPLPRGMMVSVREDKQTFRNLVENSPDIISRYSRELVCLYTNGTLARYSPIPPALHIGLTLEERGLPQHVCDAFRHARDQVMHSGKPCVFENQLIHQGRSAVFESRLLPEFDEQGNIQSLLCIDRDISEEHAIRLWQEDENRLLEMIANDRPLQEVMVWTCHMIESQIDGALCSIMQLDESGQQLRLAAGPKLPEFYRQQIDGVSIGHGVGSCGTAAFTGEAVIVTDIPHHPFWADYAELATAHGLYSCWSYPIKSYDGSVLGTFAIYFGHSQAPDLHSEYITHRTSHLMAIAIQQQQRAKRLFQLATQDALTGLHNRRHFMQLAQTSCDGAHRQHLAVCLLMFDLDHFKQINDRYGHAAGDDALRVFARILQDNMRSHDLPCRMGGEEFAALLSGMGAAEARRVAEGIRKQLAATEVDSDGQRFKLTVSTGIAQLQNSHDLSTLMRQADKALYRAKHEGRNCICIALPAEHD